MPLKWLQFYKNIDLLQGAIDRRTTPQVSIMSTLIFLLLTSLAFVGQIASGADAAAATTTKLTTKHVTTVPSTVRTTKTLGTTKHVTTVPPTKTTVLTTKTSGTTKHVTTVPPTTTRVLTTKTSAKPVVTTTSKPTTLPAGCNLDQLDEQVWHILRNSSVPPLPFHEENLNSFYR